VCLNLLYLPLHKLFCMRAMLGADCVCTAPRELQIDHACNLLIAHGTNRLS
jgi:hypothetical protein